MIPRDLTPRLLEAASHLPVVTVTGPRQSGKTTLCRQAFPAHPHVNLELPDVRAHAISDPRAFLADHPDGAILDEVQRAPDLMSYLQDDADRHPDPGRWILTGSQNLLLLDAVNQSLAGRAAVLHLLPCTRPEVQRFDGAPTDLDQVLVAGGYPRIHDRRMPPAEFLDGYIATYLERDVRSIINVGDLVTFQTFLGLCAGRTGQLLNLSALASDCGIAQPTARAWLSVLEASFVAFRLPAWHGNLRKRLTRTPKLHFWDTGLVCRLLGINEPAQLRTHPLRGSIFETWVVSETARRRLHRGQRGGLHHFRTQQGAEVDLVLDDGNGLDLIEAKAGQTLDPRLADGLRRVVGIMGEERVNSCRLVHGGDERRTVGPVEMIGWGAFD